MSKYIVSLTPLGKYFFGGDMTFKVSDKNDYNERYSSYVIQSGQFPQQTSLLGMMRFLLLSNKPKNYFYGKSPGNNRCTRFCHYQRLRK